MVEGGGTAEQSHKYYRPGAKVTCCGHDASTTDITVRVLGEGVLVFGACHLFFWGIGQLTSRCSRDSLCFMPKDERVGVGVATIIRDGPCILMGKRLSKHAYGTWSLPGGWLGYGETLGAAAIREVAEETGIDVRRVELYDVTSEIHSEVLQTVTVYLLAREWTGTPEVLEPTKCACWKWINLQEPLPEPLFPGIPGVVKTLG